VGTNLPAFNEKDIIYFIFGAFAFCDHLSDVREMILIAMERSASIIDVKAM